MPRFDDDDDDDYDDRPRKPKKKKKKAPATPAWVKLAAGGVSFVVFFALAFFLVRGLSGNSQSSGSKASDGTGSAKQGGGGAPVAAGGVKYVPHESEEKFSAFLKSQGKRLDITEAEVLAIMGEPTRRDPPITGKKNGMTFTIVECYWEVPGSGIKSTIGFVNGFANGMAIGIKTGK